MVLDTPKELQDFIDTCYAHVDNKDGFQALFDEVSAQIPSEADTLANFTQKFKKAFLITEYSNIVSWCDIDNKELILESIY